MGTQQAGQNNVVKGIAQPIVHCSAGWAGLVLNLSRCEQAIEIDRLARYKLVNGVVNASSTGASLPAPGVPNVGIHRLGIFDAVTGCRSESAAATSGSVWNIGFSMSTPLELPLVACIAPVPAPAAVQRHGATSAAPQPIICADAWSRSWPRWVACSHQAPPSGPRTSAAPAHLPYHPPPRPHIALQSRLVVRTNAKHGPVGRP